MQKSLINVLIIDDEIDLCQYLAAYLENRGYGTIYCGSGQETMELLNSGKVDICIVDIRLPDINGNVLIQKVHELYPKMKFLIITGSIGFQHNDSLAQLGVGETEVFKKPILDMGDVDLAIKRQFNFD